MAKTATKTGNKRASGKSMKKAVSSRKCKAREVRAESAGPEVAEDEVAIDRRRAADRRTDEVEVEFAETPNAPKLERRQKVNRRRQIDPTTCERDYTDQEVEFMNALDDYKRKSGRMFPTCSEVLEVIQSLGYVKLSHSQLMSAPSQNSMPSAQPMKDEARIQENLDAAVAGMQELI